MSTHKVCYAIILLTGLFICNSSSAATPGFQQLTSIEQTQYHLHKSLSLKHDYHLYVRLPNNINLKSAKKYPTVYLLDGGITYPLLAAYSQYLSMAKDIPELIIVGISYGTDDYREGNKRSTDFTAPAKGRDHYGGAAKFQNMLSNELFPFIESNYPSDPKQRIVFGQSLGGQFAIFNAISKPDLFMGLIASNPALHRNLEFFLSSQLGSNQPKTKPLLFISRSENDENRFKKPAQKWIDHWQNLDSKPFKMKIHSLDGHNHFSAAPEAFRNGLIWIFD